MDRWEITLASICISVFIFFILIIALVDNSNKSEEINKLQKQAEVQNILIERLLKDIEME